MGVAHRRRLSDEGSTQDLLARLQALYEEWKKAWKQAQSDYLTMKAPVAKFEFF